MHRPCHACLQPDVLSCSLQWESERLAELLVAELPREHPMYDHVSRAVDTMLSIPGWSWGDKERFVTKLIRRSKKLTA